MRARIGLRRRSAVGALGLSLLGSACAGSSPEDPTASVEAGEVGDGVSTVPEPLPDAGPPRERTVGDTVAVGVGGSLAVLATEPEVNAGRLFSPGAGQQYYAAEVKGCAGPNEEGLSFEPEYFVLRMDAGGVSLPGLGVKKPDLRGADLPAGECLSGWITFSIPAKAKAVGVAYNGSTVLEWKIP